MGAHSTMSLLSRMVSSSRIPSASRSWGRRRRGKGGGGEEEEGEERKGGGGKEGREERQSDFQLKLGLGLGRLIQNLVHVHAISALTGKVNYLNVHIKITQSPSQYRLSSCNVPYVHCIYCRIVQR